jgi:hypothetical protein
MRSLLVRPARLSETPPGGRQVNSKDTQTAGSVVSRSQAARRHPTVSQSIADAGQAEVDAVGKLATFLAVALAVVAIASFAVFWVPIRLAFVRRATAAQRFVDANEDLDLFALRAMARQPLHVLARISDDPAGAWRRQDRRVVHALATLELKEEGLRPPPLAERPA